jgi:hypothetical protein
VHNADAAAGHLLDGVCPVVIAVDLTPLTGHVLE